MKRLPDQSGIWHYSHDSDRQTRLLARHRANTEYLLELQQADLADIKTVVYHGFRESLESQLAMNATNELGFRQMQATSELQFQQMQATTEVGFQQLQATTEYGFQQLQATTERVFQHVQYALGEVSGHLGEMSGQLGHISGQLSEVNNGLNAIASRLDAQLRVHEQSYNVLQQVLDTLKNPRAVEAAEWARQAARNIQQADSMTAVRATRLIGEAFELLEKSLEINDYDPKAHFDYGWLLRNCRNDMVKAREHFDTAVLRALPHDKQYSVFVLRNLAEVCLELKDFPAAVAATEEARTLIAPTPELHIEHARHLIAAGRQREALTLLTDLINWVPHLYYQVLATSGVGDQPAVQSLLVRLYDDDLRGQRRRIDEVKERFAKLCTFVDEPCRRRFLANADACQNPAPLPPFTAMRSVFDKHCSNLEFEINQLIAAHEQRMREEEALWKREQEEERLREVEARRKREQAEQRLRAEDSRRNREQEEERRRAEDARWQREQEEERLRKEEEWLRTREEYFKRVDEKQRRRDEEQELRWLKLKLKRRRRFYVELVVFSALYSTVLLPLWFPSRERYDLPGWYWGGVGIFGFSVMWGGFRMYADGNSGGIVFKLFAIVPLFIFVAFGLVPALDRAIHVYSMLGAQSGF